jgi:4-amino-4-deoxy-L-arabinose transferase-like glycosyltransferase
MKKHIGKIIFSLIVLLAIFLRIYKVDTLLSPYWEEVALGYDAYSISETMRDHHGNFMPLVAFESFGDWKPSFYFYTLVPFIKLIGLNVLAVRLPSVLAGLGIVLGVYVLLKKILPKNLIKERPYLPLLGMFITAISPWAIMFSRAGWEVNLATGFILWGVICFISFIKENRNKKLKYFSLISSIVLLSLSMYTYHATRMIAPLLGFSLIWLWFAQTDRSKRIKKSIEKFVTTNFIILIGATFITLILTVPIIISLTDKITSQRFTETSVFSQLSIIEESNAAQLSQPNIIGKVFYHRYFLFTREVLTNYLDHFTIDFLFLSGDENPRHSVQYFGQLYHIELIYLLLGTYFVLSAIRKIKNDPYDNAFKNYLWLLITWLLIAIIPASLTKTTPHALRILPALPVFMILITLGVGQFIEELSNLLSKINLKHKYLKKIILKLIVLIYILELAVFWRFYTLIYPVQYASEWQAGYAQMIEGIKDKIGSNIPIYITREQGRPAMYLWFYNKTNPRLVQEWDKLGKQDQGEYLEFQNVKFVNSLDEVTDTPATIVGSQSQVEGLFNNESKNNNLTITHSINAINGKNIWHIGEL